MGGSHNRAQIVGVFHAIQHYQQPGARQHLIQRLIMMGRAHGDHSLMIRTGAEAIQRILRLEAQGNGVLARQIDDLLNARTPGSARDQDPVQRAPGPQRFAHRMHAGENSGGFCVVSRSF